MTAYKPPSWPQAARGLATLIAAILTLAIHTAWRKITRRQGHPPA